jgi:RHS repeat-associated protein
MTPTNPSQDWQSCSQGNYPVDCMSGAFYHDFTDLSIPGRGVALDLSRSYDSLAAATDGPFGYGWSSSYAMRLSVDPASGAVTVYQENGSTVTFTPANGGYSAPPRVLATLTSNADGSFTMTRRATTTFVFSPAGQLVGETDLNGYATTLAYNGADQLSTVTDPAGRALSFAYWPTGLVSKVTDPAGRSVSYGYDGSGNLTSATDPAGRVWGFGYDANHLMTSMTDPAAGVVTNIYDSSGRVKSQTDPAGLTTGYSYVGSALAGTGGSTTVTDPHGNVEVQVYYYGELTSLTRGSGSAAAGTWSYDYDPNTLQVTSETDPDGNVTDHTYDVEGNVLSTKDAGGYTTTFTYNTFNEPLTVTDPMGILTAYHYYAMGNLWYKTVTGNGGSPVYTTTDSYGDAYPGDVTGVTDAAGHVTNSTYDVYGNVSSTSMHPSTSETDTTGYVSDSVGRKVCEASPKATAAGVVCPPAGQPPVADTTTSVYNPDSQLTSLTDPLGHTTLYGYDPNGNQNQVTDPSGNITATVFDADNRPKTVTKGAGSPVAATTTNAYDLAPGTGACQAGVAGATYCTTVTDPDGHVTVSYLDAQDHPVQTVDPASGTTTNTYDPAGNLSTKTTPSGVATYGYDADNHQKSITYSQPALGYAPAPNVTYSYDPDGRRSKMTDGTGTTTYTPDSLDRLGSSTNGVGSTVTYGYDPDNNVTTVTYPNNKTVTYTYDGAGNGKTVTDWQGHQTAYTYDPNANPTAENLPNGDTSTTTYNNADQLGTISDAPTATPASPVATMTYGRNPDGFVSSETDSGLPGPDAQTYTYDQRNQLGTDSATGTYTYDPAGNPTSQPGVASQGHNTNGQLCYTGASAGTCASPPPGATTYQNNTAGGRVQTQPPATSPTNYSYNQAGELSVPSNTKQFVSLAPTRICDTRPGNGSGLSGAAAQCNGINNTGEPVPAGGTLTVNATGTFGSQTVPASAYAVVVNVTVATNTAPTFLLAYPAGSARPAQGSNVNDSIANQAANNQVTVALGTGGQVAIYNNGGTVNLVVDIVGYYQSPPTADNGYTALAGGATRICDTRPGNPSGLSGPAANCNGANNSGTTLGTSLNGGSQDRSIGVSGSFVPPGATAVVVDVTGVMPNATTYLTAHADSTPTPATSSVNLSAGTVVTKEVTVPVGYYGGITITNNYGAVDVVVDVEGYFMGGTGSQYTPVTSERICDTRPANPSALSGSAAQCNGTNNIGTTIPAGGTITVNVTSLTTGIATPIPANATAVVLNVAAVNGTTAGFARVYPTGQPPPNTSSLNYPAATAVSNEVTTALGAGGQLNVTANTSTDMIIDVEGYYTPPAGTYSYNGDGLRMTKTVNSGGTEAFTWDTNTPNGTPRPLVDGATSYVYAPDGSVLEQISPTGTLYYLHDQLGSTRALTDPTGAPVATYSYTPYGQLSATTGSPPAGDTNPIGYAGGYTDPETGLLYLHHRYYDPQTAQFISVDPAVAMTGEPYTYADDNPINETDPTGLFHVPGTNWCIGTCSHHNPGAFSCASPSTTPFLLASDSNAISCGSGALASGSLVSGSTPEQARAAAEQSGYTIPGNYVAERQANDQGWVFRAPGSSGNGNIIRIGEPNSQNPNGYVRYYNASGQPLNSLGKPGSDPDTHLPLRPGDDNPDPLLPEVAICGGGTYL